MNTLAMQTAGQAGHHAQGFCGVQLVSLDMLSSLEGDCTLPSQEGCLSLNPGSDGKESSCNVGDLGSIPGSGRSPGEWIGYPLQYSCLENLIDTGAWWATVHGVAKSWIQLSDEHTHTHTYTHTRAVGAFGWLILGKRRSELLGLSACGFVCELKAGKDGTLPVDGKASLEGGARHGGSVWRHTHHELCWGPSLAACICLLSGPQSSSRSCCPHAAVILSPAGTVRHQRPADE